MMSRLSLKNMKMPWKRVQKTEGAPAPAGKKKRKKFKWIAVLAVFIVCGAGAFLFLKGKAGIKPASASAVRTATVETRSIQSALSSSGSIAPKDTYNITALVDGEVLSADFEEGDYVEEGQVLYVIDSASMDSKLKSSQNSLERAQTNYEEALREYNDAVSKYGSNTMTAKESGYITQLYVDDGDTVNTGSKIADVYDNRKMKLKLPFLSGEAAALAVGQAAEVTLVDSFEVLAGTVSAISSMEEVLTGNRLVRYVTILVDNPGGLSESLSATAVVGGIACSGEGTFAPYISTTLVADCSGEIAKLSVSEGDLVEVGSALFVFDSNSVQKQLNSYHNSLQNAEENLENAQNNLDDYQDNLDNYTITAPISGKVITKSVKAGDTLKSSGQSSTTMATIYDLSQVTFEMYVDELDVHSVEVGQTVEVTADAISDYTFSGKVTNVSLSSTSSQGVTNYPVTVTLDEVGDLLPGMNVNGKIILEEASDVLTIPVDALMRGNTVYVQDDSARESDGRAPAGFKEVQVETGLINDDYVEIVSGLSEGDVVYINATSKDSSSMQQMMPAGMPSGGQMPSGGMPSGGMPGGGDRGGRQ